MKVIIATFLFVLALVGNSIAEMNKVEYELQEKCGNNAAKYVKEQYGRANYTNHYNKKLNRCFALIDFQVGNDSVYSSVFCEGEGAHITLLKDVNENKQYGIIVICSVSGKTGVCNIFENDCDSQAEWHSFIRTYMEE